MDDNVLAFAIFMIHKLADVWELSPWEVYQRLTRTNVLDGYIIPCYDVLHTLGAQYLIEDITGLVKERESAS